ncbi:MAG: YebC/PmpR family DNA-binding transcriptional regulator [Kiritimatiellales bacterium]|nr:YebC/PmpR family DNA-binding transcriptional regulator [Kiritimatiellales bacterium]
MSGHSKWANIKHRKGKADAARGKMFSKLAKDIMVAASCGGGNPAENITLRALIQKAKGISMPKENIDRAIKKGTGELEGGQLTEGSYEAYAAGGIAVVVKVLTDNKNRSASEVRFTFSKAGSDLAPQGSVSRMFQRKGQIFIDKDKTDEDTLMDLVLEAGAEDLKTDGDQFEVITDPSDFDVVSEAITNAGIEMAESEITMIPDLVVEVADIDQARSIMKLVDALDDLDDVQNVYANFDLSDEVAAQLEAE